MDIFELVGAEVEVGLLDQEPGLTCIVQEANLEYDQFWGLTTHDAVVKGIGYIPVGSRRLFSVGSIRKVLS